VNHKGHKDHKGQLPTPKNTKITKDNLPMSVFTNTSPSLPDQATQYVAAILDLLGSRDPIGVLRSTPHALGRSLDSMSSDQARQPEAPGKWSVRHVLQHLADAELVWGYRTRMVLGQDRPSLIGYDQDLWAERLYYDQIDPRDALDAFTALRRINLKLIERATPADRKRAAVHAERGEESFEHMINLSAGHDLLHLQQVERIRAAVVQG
jgi:uncharacterized damage-inducible protein DinB